MDIVHVRVNKEFIACMYVERGNIEIPYSSDIN